MVGGQFFGQCIKRSVQGRYIRVNLVIQTLFFCPLCVLKIARADGQLLRRERAGQSPEPAPSGSNGSKPGSNGSASLRPNADGLPSDFQLRIRGSEASGPVRFLRSRGRHSRLLSALSRTECRLAGLLRDVTTVLDEPKQYSTLDASQKRLMDERLQCSYNVVDALRLGRAKRML